MPKQPRTPGRQTLTRIVLVVNLLLCLMMLVIVDLAAGTGQTTLLWISGSLLLVCLLLLVWLFRIVRSEGTYQANPSAVISLAHARWVLLILLLVATALRFYHLGWESFWYDEVWTGEWGRQPLGAVWQIVNPLPYAIAHLLLRIGDSEFVLRSVSALVGILTVPVVYILGQTLYGRREGLIAATYTPLRSNGSLNLDRVPPLVEHLLGDGVGGLYVCGSTGEGVSLTGDERRAVAEAYTAAAAGRVAVIVQVGHNSLAEARSLAEHAQQIGADAISATCPSYFKISTAELLVDCMAEAAAGAPDLPFYYYQCQQV